MTSNHVQQSSLKLAMAEEKCITDAVQLDNVWKSYGSTPVLRGVDISVSRGSIYGLLGPSGCGKTTLLRCIVGRITSDIGTVSIFGHRPGSRKAGVPGPKVGYMPQELALFQELTIEETLRYFGHIYHMKADKIKFRTSFLLDFLNLPKEWRLIKNLSGGQQRRASFAAALLHEPPLLILDEPTVGVDPLLRRAIWQHLLDITKTSNVTVMITTHYIEEARQANRVGLLRNGKLLAEAEPQYLLTQQELPTLEDVFLKLCQKDDVDPAIEEPPPKVKGPAEDCSLRKRIGLDFIAKFKAKEKKLSFSSPNHLHVNESADVTFHPKKRATSSCWPTLPSIDMINALVGKNFKKVIRQRGFLGFQFLIPVIQVILLCLAVGGDPKNINIAVWNNDTGGYGYNLGKLFLSHINTEVVTQIVVEDEDVALNMVLDGDAWGMVTIGTQFTQHLIKRFLSPTRKFGDDIMNGSTINIRLDMTDQQIGYSLQRTFMTAFLNFEDEAAKNRSRMPLFANVPIKFGDPVYGTATPNFTEYIAPGMILTICYFMAVSLTALSFVMERKEGLLDRSYVAGVNAVELMLSHVVTQFGVMVIQVALVLIFIIVVFHVPSRGPIIYVILLSVLQGMAGMTYGFVISTICDSEFTAVMLALGTFYPNLMLSGVIWPLESMPQALWYFSILLPQTYPILALRCILSRGSSITYMPVWRGYLVTFAWIGIFLTLSVILMRIKRK